MKGFVLLALAPLAFGSPAAAQSMAGIPGMSMPTKPTAKSAAKTPHAKKPPQAGLGHQRRAMPRVPAIDGGADMAGMPMPSAAADGANSMPGMNMSRGTQGQAAGGQDMAAMPGMGEPENPNTPPPPAPTDHAADQDYDPSAMAAARATLRQEHGGENNSRVMANLAEYQTGPGGGGYRWDGQAYFGGDTNGLLFTSEGDGSRRDGLGSAELQALYSRAITPYFDLHAGVRQDFAPRGRTYATVGFQGLAPYWFDIQGALFLSTEGELLGRLEGDYDLRLTQRLILQPRAELNFAAQNTLATQTGSGLSNAELGLRLRYEISREFAPYIGISYDRKTGMTADFARNRGEDVGGASFVAGVRAWF
jgi:copper resistance protein B